MAKDDLAGTGLDDDEIELIRARRRQRREEADTEIWIKDGDKEARVPYGRGRNWLRKHGFDLDDDAGDDDGAKDDDGDGQGDDDAKEPGKTVRFGRRTG